jgi:uncharacterized protein (TIGR03083 family)
MDRQMQAYVDALDQATRSFTDLVRSLRPDQWDRPTECPGWTVRDQVAHVVALERQLLGEPLPSRLASYPAYVRGPAGEHMENGVAALRGLSTGDLLTALRELCARHVAELRAADLAPDTLVQGALGNEVPAGRALPVRVFDVWAHEQDVRRAVAAPGNLAGAAADVARDQIAMALPYVVGKQVSPPAGTRVAVDVSGPTTLQATVVVGADGRAEAEPGVAVDATTTLRMDFETLTRLACGRVAPDAAPVTVEGDPALGGQVLAALAITP